MNAHRWGLKTFYYSLIDKQGSKSDKSDDEPKLEVIDFDEEGSCESCKL